jgi:hypothetical protein
VHDVGAVEALPLAKAFDQIISSAGHRRSGLPSTSPVTLCWNHSSSTTATPFPEL